LSDSAPASAIATALHGGYQSAYDLSSPIFTTYKTRGTNTVQRIIDYILYQGQLQCTHRLSIPKEREMEAHKLPGLRYPSDHVMIAAKFTLDPPP
jgi:mRNA deadenylase 3'-5' endonuclease subunit Ccr4